MPRILPRRDGPEDARNRLAPRAKAALHESVNESASRTAVIVGAGVSGLAAAVVLRRRGWRVTVLDSSARVGGAARAFRRDGFLCEEGPNTLLVSRPETRAFLEETGMLAKACEAAPDAQNRFVVFGGRLVAVPASPAAFFRSPLLSFGAKLRLCGEPFRPRGRDPDETLAGFVRRRLGSEPLRELVGPFVSGVFAGNPERLLVRHAFPRLWRLEQEHGSLIRGALKKGGGAGPKGKLVSWPGGLQELPEALARETGDVRLGAEVSALRREGGRLVVRVFDDELGADRVILATDVDTAARLLAPHLGDALRPFREIPWAPIAVVHLGFRREDVAHPLNGFGALISRARGLRTLGALFSSTLFPGRAPEGKVLLTCFMGGALDPEATLLDDDALVGQTLRDLDPLLGLKAAPAFRHTARWPRAIPQYESRHGEVAGACAAAEAALPGLRLLGNFRGGISMNDCLGNAVAAAREM